MILIVRSLIVVKAFILSHTSGRMKMAKARTNTGPDILRAFGQAVREARLERGLSQEKLAERAGLDRTYVGGIERGERNVAIINIFRVAAALGIPPSSLLLEVEKRI